MTRGIFTTGLTFIFDTFSYVNFDKERTEETKYRFDQPACNGCGNCTTGCNTGAKNTLNMNYLPDAKVHGAKIFTRVILFFT